MLSGFISGLITAFILSIFNVNNMLLEVLQPLTTVLLTNSHYYVLFGLIGLIGGAFSGRSN